MNTKYLVVVAVMAAMLVAATALATADNAFADKKKKSYGKSQALSQATSCGNSPFISVADFCQDIGSQSQGEENSVAQSGNQSINLNFGTENGDLTASLLGDTANSLMPQETQ
jgi:hypothetical protein